MSITPEADSNTLGSLLQTTTTIASISIALYAALYTIESSIRQVDIPRVIFLGLGFSGFFSLVACIIIQRRLRIIFKIPSTIIYKVDSYWSHLFLSIVLLWVVYLLLVFPGIANFISSIFSGNVP